MESSPAPLSRCAVLEEGSEFPRSLFLQGLFQTFQAILQDYPFGRTELVACDPFPLQCFQLIPNSTVNSAIIYTNSAFL